MYISMSLLALSGTLSRIALNTKGTTMYGQHCSTMSQTYLLDRGYLDVYKLYLCLLYATCFQM